MNDLIYGLRTSGLDRFLDGLDTLNVRRQRRDVLDEGTNGLSPVVLCSVFKY